jgi:DNA-binding transcriptional LysR family regulator
VPLLSELEDAEGSLRQVAVNPRGMLRVDMSSTHAQRLVLPRIDAFRERYPNIELHVSSGDRLVDLLREGVDCVLRAGTPRDSTLVARRLAMMPQVLCASPAYLARFGIPQQPEELSAHETVGFASRSGQLDHSVELLVDGQLRSFAAGGWMSVNDSESYVVCAKRGCGLIQLPRFHVEHELHDGQLVEVLAGWASPAMQLSALYPFSRQLSPRVRVFVDWLVEIYEEVFEKVPAVNVP